MNKSLLPKTQTKQFKCRVQQDAAFRIVADTSGKGIRSQETMYKMPRGRARRLDVDWLHQCNPVFYLIGVNGRYKCSKKCRDKARTRG